jgi:hypothetical protein
MKEQLRPQYPNVIMPSESYNEPPPDLLRFKKAKAKKKKKSNGMTFKRLMFG